MARIAGVDLPPNKRVEIALTYIYGIGRTQAAKILKESAINLDTKVRDLNDDEINKIRSLSKNNTVSKRLPANCADSD